jgi:hypothetical protein
MTNIIFKTFILKMAKSGIEVGSIFHIKISLYIKPKKLAIFTQKIFYEDHLYFFIILLNFSN